MEKAINLADNMPTVGRTGPDYLRPIAGTAGRPAARAASSQVGSSCNVKSLFSLLDSHSAINMPIILGTDGTG